MIHLVLVFPELKRQKHDLLHSMATESYTRLHGNEALKTGVVVQK